MKIPTNEGKTINTVEFYHDSINIAVLYTLDNTP